MEHKELLLGLVPVANKGQELIPHKDYEIKQDGEKFYLVKKKKEYPKTYKECCEVIEDFITIGDYWGYKHDLFVNFQKLILCRDAYWKIAGEEMGLGKPWKPDWNDEKQDKYGFYNEVKYTIINSTLFVFPTAEMRDAFCEYFKELIEQCKELL